MHGKMVKIANFRLLLKRIFPFTFLSPYLICNYLALSYFTAEHAENAKNQQNY